MRAQFFYFCLVAVLSLTSTGARADEGEVPVNAVVADLGLHVVGVGHQRVITPRISGQLAVDLYVPWTQNRDLFGISNGYRGDVAGLILRGRVFVTLLGTAQSGLWVSPFFQVGVGTAKTGELSELGPLGAVGTSVGYQAILLKHLLISGGLGVQYHAAAGPPRFGGFYPTVDLVVGYAW